MTLPTSFGFTGRILRKMHDDCTKAIFAVQYFSPYKLFISLPLVPAVTFTLKGRIAHMLLMEMQETHSGEPVWSPHSVPSKCLYSIDQLISDLCDIIDYLWLGSVLVVRPISSRIQSPGLVKDLLIRFSDRRKQLLSIDFKDVLGTLLIVDCDGYDICIHLPATLPTKMDDDSGIYRWFCSRNGQTSGIKRRAKHNLAMSSRVNLRVSLNTWQWSTQRPPAASRAQQIKAFGNCGKGHAVEELFKNHFHLIPHFLF